MIFRLEVDVEGIVSDEDSSFAVYVFASDFTNRVLIEGSEPEETLVDTEDEVLRDEKAVIILQPGECPPDFPVSSITLQLSFI